MRIIQGLATLLQTTMPYSNSNSLSFINISIASLEHNYKSLAKFVGQSEVSAVVKANAYGLGAVNIAKSLSQFGCKSFYVATIDEAIELRKSLEQDVRIYTLNGIDKGEEYYFLEHHIIPVINSFDQLSLWSGLAKKLDVDLPANIFFDTKMYRLGFDYYDAEKVKQKLEDSRLNIHFIMSHLACAHFRDHQQNKEQLDKFKQLADIFPKYRTSFCNSDGILLSDEFNQFDQIRVGTNLYGCGAHAKSANLKHVASLHSTIIQIRKVKEEGYIGYSALEKVTPGMKIAILAIGFADGYFLRQANHLKLFVAGKICNAIGLVSMDLLAIDVTDIEDDKLYEGQAVEIYGKNISIETVQEISNTISYGLFTSMGRRVKRNYVDK